MDSVSTPQKRRSTSSQATPATPASHAKAQESSGSKKKRINGVWKNGQWWCNCDPRSEATLREVKKEGPNKGRLFWACRVYPFCDLFLWREHADARESRMSKGFKHKKGGEEEEFYYYHDDIESEQQVEKHKTPTFTQKPLESFGIQTSPARRLSILDDSDEDADDNADDDADDDGGSESTNASFVSADIMREHAFPSASGTTNPASPSPTTPSSKRKRTSTTSQGNWENDDSFSDLNSDEERELAELADDSAKKQVVAPKKVSDDVFATPTTGRGAVDIVAGLPTPPVSRTLFPSSDGKRPKTVSFEDPSPSSMLKTPSKMAPPSTTSRPGGSISAGASAGTVVSSSPLCGSIQDLANQVMGLIRGQNINPTVFQAVQGRLNTAVKMTNDIIVTRDRALESLKERDERMKKLREKNGELRQQATRERETLTKTKQGLRRLYEDI
ncbi:hypothetical protein E4U21_005512 [Claviceps maximensis]|nr:hypothetical protein E4U21_005512 [Claviceps maximensis]